MNKEKKILEARYGKMIAYLEKIALYNNWIYLKNLRIMINFDFKKGIFKFF